jgi:hypothetical protein
MAPRLDPAASTQLATITAAHTAPWTLRTEHEAVASEDQRRELLGRVQAGEALELYLDLVAFTQTPGVQNRNFVRFARLDMLAATGPGTAFLRDHAQHQMGAVGGVIVSSTMVASGAALELRQTAHLVETWALRAALLKLLRGFSIGWNPMPVPGQLEPEIHCTVCKAPVRACLWELGHWRGKAVAGQLVEWEFQNAELLETSAIPVPAVRETRPLEMREHSPAELAAELSAFGVTVQVPCALTHDHEENMLKNIALALGLAAEATEDQVLAAVRDRDGRIASLTAERDAAAAAATTAQAQADAGAGELAEQKARAWADTLVAEGRLAPEGALHDHLVAQHRQDAVAAQRIADALPVTTPVGRSLQTERTDEKTPTTKADGTPNYEALAGKLNAEDLGLVRLSKRSAVEYVRANYAELALEYGWPTTRSN